MDEKTNPGTRPAAGSAPQGRGTPRPLRILLVDDSMQIRKILRNFLLQAFPGSTFVEAGIGIEGFNAFELNPDLDLVLSDFHMPDCNGLEMLKRIIASGRKVPVIMVTSETEKKWVLQCLQAGASNYVTKPFNAETLTGRVRQVLGKAGS